MTTTTAEMQAKSFDVPDEHFTIGDKGRVDTVQVNGVTFHRATFRPGFVWTEHARPIAGTDLCQLAHTGYIVSGRVAIRMADGTEREMGAGDIFDIPPGHDMWVVGDEPYVAVDSPDLAARYGLESDAAGQVYQDVR